MKFKKTTYSKSYKALVSGVLPDGEIHVHHIDHDRDNNHISNLVALPKKLHYQYHYTINRIGQELHIYSKEISLKEIDELEAKTKESLKKYDDEELNAAKEFVAGRISNSDLMEQMSTYANFRWISRSVLGSIKSARATLIELTNKIAAYKRRQDLFINSQTNSHENK